jgi:hypothetical protein
VKGTITFNGNPIPEGCLVNFTPEGGTGIGASGAVGSGGSFQLRAKSTLDIPVGIYKVSVTPPPPATQNMTPEEAMKASVEGRFPTSEVKEVPEKYRSPDTSGEVFEVKEGANEYTLDMKPAK